MKCTASENQMWLLHWNCNDTKISIKPASPFLCNGGEILRTILYEECPKVQRAQVESSCTQHFSRHARKGGSCQLLQVIVVIHCIESPIELHRLNPSRGISSEYDSGLCARNGHNPPNNQGWEGRDLIWNKARAPEAMYCWSHWSDEELFHWRWSVTANGLPYLPCKLKLSVKVRNSSPKNSKNVQREIVGVPQLKFAPSKGNTANASK